QAFASQQTRERFGRQSASVRPGRAERLRREKAELLGCVILVIRPHQAAIRQLDRSQREARAGLAVAFADGLRAIERSAASSSVVIGRFD
ncbi:hypothetical protein OIV57_33290, partial [Burkholderia pseudomallei]|uniref:hypothetical protein n=1 Tax=Burkholderia pseudomallei TaxID=28450 RepID=UPI0021F6B533